MPCRTGFVHATDSRCSGEPRNEDVRTLFKQQTQILCSGDGAEKEEEKERGAKH